MKKFLIIVMMGLCMTVLAPAGWAEETAPTVESNAQIKTGSLQGDPRWVADRARLENLASENLTEEEDCQIRWDILWSWAKKGNLEARADLFFYSYPAGAHAPQMFMPGRSGDDISRRRDAVILGIHSLGVEFNKQEWNDTYRDLSEIVFKSILNDGFRGSAFLECLKTTSGQKCAQGAQKKLIPSFENYAAEIDALLAHGMKPTCFFIVDHSTLKP